MKMHVKSPPPPPQIIFSRYGPDMGELHVSHRLSYLKVLAVTGYARLLC